MCENYSSPTITNCTISGNIANGDGGAVRCQSWGVPVISNCTISGNHAGRYGGAIRCGSGDPMPRITNCTITRNSAARGGALSCGTGQPIITNSILWDDAPEEIHLEYGNALVTYSNVQGGWAGEGNIDADPLFVGGFLGDYYLSQTAAGQPVDSPCVDAGSDTAENLGLDTRTTRTDQVGDTGIVDMGYHYPIVCVGDLDGDGDTDQSDLGILLADWGCDDPVNGCVGDLNADDRTDQADLGILLADWGCTN
jgi:hypothetical protein